MQRPAAAVEGQWKHDRHQADGPRRGDSYRGGSDSRRADSRQQGGKTAKLVVTNLHYEVSENELKVSIPRHRRQQLQQTVANDARSCAGSVWSNWRDHLWAEDQGTMSACLSRRGGRPCANDLRLHSLTHSPPRPLLRPRTPPARSSASHFLTLAFHQYDRSGRSTGLAWVTYASESQASKAKDAFDGAPAKGERPRPPLVALSGLAT